MNAVGIYVSTCRYVMRGNPHDPSSWADLYRYLPYLRQALGCCVCTNVLHIPMGPAETVCQHHVCKGCRGGKMRLRPTCSWCKDHSNFVENVKLRIIVQCFKKLCEYLTTTSIARTLANNTTNGGTNGLTHIIQEGLDIRDSYTHDDTCPGFGLLPPLPNQSSSANSPESNCSPSGVDGPECSRRVGATTRRRLSETGGGGGGHVRSDAEVASSGTSTGKHVNEASRSPRRQELKVDVSSDDKKTSPKQSPSQAPASTQKISQTVAQEHDYNKDSSVLFTATMSNTDTNIPKIKIRKVDAPSPGPHSPRRRASRLGSDSTTSPATSGTEENCVSSTVNMEQRVRKSKSNLRKPKIKVGCRCGLATPTPGKLTCCGQRCPCYSSFTGCIPDCRCRGCRNPRKVPDKEPVSQSTHNDTDIVETDDSEIEIDV